MCAVEVKRLKAEDGRISVIVDRMNRIREELERNVVWCSLGASDAESSVVVNTLISKEGDRSKLEMKSFFALRMSSFFTNLFCSTDGIFREIADILREGVVEELHVKRLCIYIFGYTVYFKKY